MTRIPLLLFILSVLIASLLTYCLLATQSADIPGGPHPTFPEMNQGGTAERHADLIVVAGFYGALQIGVFVTVLCLGIRRDRGSILPLVGGGAAYVAVFTAMVMTYGRGMNAAATVFGLPLSTAILFFGMPSVPVVFVVLYIVKFDQWVYSASDAQQFAELQARFPLRQQDGTQESADG